MGLKVTKSQLIKNLFNLIQRLSSHLSQPNSSTSPQKDELEHFVSISLFYRCS